MNKKENNGIHDYDLKFGLTIIIILISLIMLMGLVGNVTSCADPLSYRDGAFDDRIYVTEYINTPVRNGGLVSLVQPSIMTP